MKIAFFTDNYYPQLGGIATSVDCFAKSLRKMGHKVYIFAPKIGGLRKQEKDVFRLPSISPFPNLPDSNRLPLPIPSKNFWKMVGFDFDIVHAHGNGGFSLLGLWVARAKKVPYILTFHIEIDRYADYFFKGKVFKPKVINAIFLKRLGNLCDGVITPSEKMKDKLRDSGVKKQIQVIPNFVNLNNFIRFKKGILRKKCGIPKNSPIILSVGRIGKEKNFEFLIRVFGKVAKFNDKAHLAIVGPDWGEMKKLIKLSSQLGIRKLVHFTGEITNNQMPDIYKDADIFVFPSISEVHPMVAIEAAASGLPLIVPKDRAYEGIVINNKNGFVLSVNEDIFADRIIQLIKNPDLLKKFGDNSPKIIRKRLNPEVLTKKLILFYRQTVKTFFSSV